MVTLPVGAALIVEPRAGSGGRAAEFEAQDTVVGERRVAGDRQNARRRTRRNVSLEGRAGGRHVGSGRIADRAAGDRDCVEEGRGVDRDRAVADGGVADGDGREAILQNTDSQASLRLSVPTPPPRPIVVEGDEGRIATAPLPTMTLPAVKLTVSATMAMSAAFGRLPVERTLLLAVTTTPAPVGATPDRTISPATD